MRFKLILPFIALLALSACRKNPPSNPCIDATETKALFNIEEEVGDTTFITNAVLEDNFVVFRSTAKYDSVKWTIGDDPRVFTTPSVRLLFLDPEQINVKLIAFRKPNNTCFPLDNGVDTLEKTFTVKERNSLAGIVGNFEGFVVGRETDKFLVTVSFNATWGYFLKNIPKGCPGYTVEDSPYPKNVGIPIQAGLHSFKFKNDGLIECSASQGSGFVRNDSLYINYQYSDRSQPAGPNGYPQKFEKFIGIRK